MEYRREIDGLRALAILPVILFHTGFHLFGGGFIGVDVFFVISGYLITSIILAEKEAGTFSLINFYERRARRILPALYFVTAVCIPFAWLWMQPNDLKNFSDSLVAVPLFASNILFWRDQLGYSPAAAQLKPLLHTWSLAVEEQYYVLFPLFILLTWRLGRRWLVGLLVAIAGFSLAAAQWGAYNKPVATFLLLPTRGWELAIGAFIALYFSQRQRLDIGDTAQQALSGTGLLLVLYAIFAFSKSTPFPSLYALVPTAGAALIILFATSKTVVGAMLGSKAFVGIGLISYSAYLWHQPLFAFSRHILFSTEPSPGFLLVLSVFVLAVSYFSWRFVEQPFRSKTKISRKAIFLLAGVISVLFLTFGVVGHKSDGFIGRFSASEQELLLSIRQLNVNSIMNAQGLEKCFLLQGTLSDLFDEKCLSSTSGKPRVVLLGDSHAAHLSSGVRHHFGRSGYRVDQWTMPGCSTFLLPESINVGPCRDLYDAFIQKVLPTLTLSDIVIVSTNWSYAATVVADAELVLSLKGGFLRLQNTPATIVVVGASPAFPQAPQALAVRQRIVEQDEIYLEAGDLTTVNELLERVTIGFGYGFINPSRVMCKKENIKVCLVKKEGSFLYLDHGHLSEFGSIYLMRELWDIYGAQSVAHIQ